MNSNKFKFQRIYYRPIEAAIRWAGEINSESKILALANNIPRPDLKTLSNWPLVYLYNERIYDGIINLELLCGKNGVTCDVAPTDCELTVRHVDLKKWMQNYYPAETPDYLFDEAERCLHPGISLEAIQILLAERQSLKVKLEMTSQMVEELTSKCKTENMTHRSETTYLSIIGAMLSLILTEPSSEMSSARYETLESLISEMLTQYPDHPGLSERTIRSKFAAARRILMQS